MAGLLLAEPILARHLAESSGEVDAKKQLIHRLLDGKVGDKTLDLLETAVSVRWSLTSDLVDAVEHVARLALLTRAERENQADEVEEQLFRFTRILDEQPPRLTPCWVTTPRRPTAESSCCARSSVTAAAPARYRSD